MAQQHINKKARPLAKTAAADDGPSSALRSHVVLGAILAFALVSLSGAVAAEFVNWDDTDYIVENYLIRDFSLQGVANIFTTPVLGMYNPLPFVLYAGLYRVWGLDPAPYHWTGLILHLTAIAVVYRFILSLTKRYESAAIVALLFAIHPMHISVVAWATEIKTSLFAIFYLLGLSTYVRYVREGFAPRYLAATLCLFIVSGLSKPSAVSFAPMLLLLDYYLSRPISRRLFLEKAPFFVVALAFGVLTLLTHRQAGDSIFELKQSYSLLNQALVSNYSIAFYFIKLLYPRNLSAIYPYPDNVPLLPLSYYVAVPVIPILAWLVYRSRTFRRELVFGLMFFALSILVVLRFIPSGFFGAANQYTYLPYTGLFFVFAQYVVRVIDEKTGARLAVKTSVVGLLCAFVVFCSWRSTVRIKVWNNSIALFDDVIQKHPTLSMAYNQRALAKTGNGDVRGGIDDLSQAIHLDPRNVDALYNRGLTLGQLNAHAEALKDLDVALALNPKHYKAYAGRGVIKIQLKEYDSALKDFDAALRLNPDYFNAYNSRGNLHFILGNPRAALADYDDAIRLNPQFGQAYLNRGSVRMKQHDTAGALDDWRRAADLGLPRALELLENNSAS